MQIGSFMKRILILGCCGAGKSTLARSLSIHTGIDIIHLDQEYWNPNWVETPKDEWNKKVRILAAKERWIMDGNYSGSLDIRLPRADTIIYLDRSTLTCLWRVLKRIWKFKGKTRPDMVAGCPERFDWDFIHYVAVFNLVSRKRVIEKLKQLKTNQQLLFLSSDREISNYLKNIKSSF